MKNQRNIKKKIKNLFHLNNKWEKKFFKNQKQFRLNFLTIINILLYIQNYTFVLYVIYFFKQKLYSQLANPFNLIEFKFFTICIYRQ